MGARMADKEVLVRMWFKGNPASQHMLRASNSNPKQIQDILFWLKIISMPLGLAVLFDLVLYLALCKLALCFFGTAQWLFFNSLLLESLSKVP